MWLNQEITQNMFIEKVKNQRVELENAQKRNKDLVKKCERLEEERGKLNKLVTVNQVDIVTGKNDLNSLLDELKAQKKLNMNTAQRLEISNEQIDMIQASIEQTNNLMFSSITELEPIKEQLSFKWDVVDCLQNKLVETRLQTAEKDALVAELKKQEAELKNDLAALKNANNNSVPISQLQEEFLAAKLREADVILEFDKLKRSLAHIKHELEDNKLETAQEDSTRDEDFFKINFNLRDKFHEKIKLEEDVSITKTVALQNELDHLRMQIKKLEDVTEDIGKRAYFNEEIKVHLHEVRTSILLRLQKTDQELDRIIEKRKKLAEKMNKDLLQIQKNIDDKNTKITVLAQEIEKLQLRNENFVKTNNQSMASMTEDTINELQDKVKNLEENIDTLSRTGDSDSNITPN